MKDCFFLSSMPFSHFSVHKTPRHTPIPTPLSPPPQKNNQNETKQKLRQVTDQKRVLKGQASFLGFCFSSD